VAAESTYKYDADGIRTEKTVNGVTTDYTLEGTDVVFETDGTNSIWYSYDGDGSLVSMELNGAKYYYVFNLQGDVVGLTDGTGAKVVEYTYDSWGKIISTTGSMADTVGVKNPYRYRGYRYDSETGLYYLQSRYYDAEMKRFINADGIVDTGNSVLSTNMFAYCENNPVNMSDPNGYIAANVVGAVVGAVIGAVGGYFLSKWLADKLKLKGWKRNVFIAGLTAVVTASAADFVGPYVAKAWNAWSAKLVGLVKGTYKSIKITSQTMRHINVSKHLWNKVLGKVTNTAIKDLINQGIRKGSWNLLANGTVQILWKYKGRIIEITGKVIDKVFRLSDAWVRK
jgi:RHS repeat-associated protein